MLFVPTNHGGGWPNPSVLKTFSIGTETGLHNVDYMI